MTHKPISSPEQESHKDGDQTPSTWSGFAEIDRAIAENRLMEYRWKKAWADRWERRQLILCGAVFVAIIIFVIVQSAVRS